MIDVFISHSSADIEFVQRLSEQLRQNGLTIWSHEESVKLGEDWSNIVDKAIDESRNILVVLSKNTDNNSWVWAEAALAVTKRSKRVIPVYSSKDLEIPFVLQTIKGIDLSDPAEFSVEADRLANLLGEDQVSMNKGEWPDYKTHILKTQLGAYALEREIDFVKDEVKKREDKISTIAGFFSLFAFGGALGATTVSIAMTVIGEESKLGALPGVWTGFIAVVASIVGLLFARKYVIRKRRESSNITRSDTEYKQ